VKLTVEQEPYLAIRSLATNYSSGYEIHTHHHPWHQLLYASSGSMTVTMTAASWMVPTGRAVFIPGRATHSIRMWGTVEMRTLYLAPALTKFDTNECRAFGVGPLLRELILRAVEYSGLDARDSHAARLIGLIVDEMNDGLVAAGDSPLVLPMPKDLGALAFVLAQPLMQFDIDELARRHGLARRTLERRYRDETGMSFGMWRQKARLLDSFRLLAEGSSVTEAALDCGYSSVSAFIAAFKSTFGYTPGKH
jgi:AraC-like DNA-binding protein